MAIDREDWNFDVPAKPGQDEPLPGSTAVVPAESRELAPSPDGYDLGESAPGSTDPIAQMPPEVIDRATYVAREIIGGDEAFLDRCREWSSDLEARVVAALSAHGHLRGLDLVDAIEKTMTLAEASEAEAWLKTLSPEHRKLLIG
jgi:hypothetical protein